MIWKGIIPHGTAMPGLARKTVEIVSDVATVQFSGRDMAEIHSLTRERIAPMAACHERRRGQGRLTATEIQS
ncbi:hypothetical protein [Bradyrhizobium sp. USDA 3364]